MFTKHIARWLILFGFLILAYYIYKSIMAVIKTATAPITGAEQIASTALAGVVNGVTALYGDIKTLASNLVGLDTGGVSDNATNANLIAAPLAPGQIVTPTTILADNGFQVSPDTFGAAYWDLLQGGIVLSPNDQKP